ncbi:hypothetical protein [Streptomyces reniochalinae]|uniref:hypothetical protein n=1 Tax=Streptomyces reniochalinae TaxID=2250578 RepID=UPI0011C066ED|nr:hypothetical protein [Streptomyces reniochalinae]
MQRRPTRATRPADTAATAAPHHTPCWARRVLIAQVAVVGMLAAGILVRELPGAVREVRIWRMVGFRAGSRHPG